VSAETVAERIAQALRRHGVDLIFAQSLPSAVMLACEAIGIRVPMMREYTVFDVDQCECLPESVTSGKPMRVRNPDTSDELADEFLRSTGADIREGYGEACYVPSRDFISMPAFEAFKSADHFYNVAFHEHWTAHGSRLDRDLKNRFCSRAYAAEELIAELGAAFQCAEFGFDGDVEALRVHRALDRTLGGRQARPLHRLQPSIKGRRLSARQSVGRAGGRRCVRRRRVPSQTRP
jgi:Zincin-like metallopeptidase